MTVRANLQIATLAGLIALGGSAVWAKGPDHARIFGEIDADGNGEITQAEVKAHGEARFAKADANGDGKITVQEYAKYRESKRKQ